MKKLTLMLLIAVILAGGAVTAVSTPSQAQYYEYTSPPPDPYAEPWVGPGTPWVYYNGDWFLNGILYLFFGPDYGWAPYYAYPYTYIVRPTRYYAPFYLTWYSTHPVIVERFVQTYPYYRSHRQGQHYDVRFYEQHHRGQGGGWQQGFKGRPAPAAPGAKPGPAQVAPPVEQKQAPTRVAPPAAPRPAPSQVAPAERPRPVPERPAPAERPKPGPTMAPPERPQPGPARVAPSEGQRPAPAPAMKPAPAPAPAPKAAPAPKPAPAPAPAAPGGAAPAEKGGGHGEEKR